MFSREKAEAIAKDFLTTMNPENWDGTEPKPDSVNTLIKTYDIDSINNNELDISFDYEKEEKIWMHYCELREKSDNELITPLHGYGVNSVPNLTDTIMDVCKDENPDENETTFYIPVTFEMCGVLVVKSNAKTAEEVIAQLEECIDELPIPTEKEYVDGSYQVESDPDIIKLYTKEATELTTATGKINHRSATFVKL